MRVQFVSLAEFSGKKVVAIFAKKLMAVTFNEYKCREWRTFEFCCQTMQCKFFKFI